jgi:hypothetical protein
LHWINNACWHYLHSFLYQKSINTKFANNDKWNWNVIKLKWIFVKLKLVHIIQSVYLHETIHSKWTTMQYERVKEELWNDYHYMRQQHLLHSINNLFIFNFHHTQKNKINKTLWFQHKNHSRDQFNFRWCSAMVCSATRVQRQTSKKMIRYHSSTSQK